MFDAVSHCNDFAIKRLIEKFGLIESFVERLDKRSFEKYLNSCVTETSDDSSQSTVKIIDYEFMNDDWNADKLMKTLSHLCTFDDIKYLVSHPVLSLYICRQYDTLNLLFSINFIIFLVALLLAAYNHSFLILAIFLTLRETTQFILSVYNKSNYFESVSNLFDFLFIIGLYFLHFSHSDDVSHRNVLSVVILLGLIQTLMITSDVTSQFAYTMFMLIKITKHFLKLFMVMSPFLIGFTIAFHFTLMDVDDNVEELNLNKFNSLSTSLVKVNFLT